MKLHVFNPEHDMALAYHQPYITLPHAIQEFKNNLSFIPALWASSGDGVLVEDVGDVGPRHARLGGGNYGLFSEHSNFPLTLFLL